MYGGIVMHTAMLTLIGLAISADYLPRDVVEIQTRSIAIPVYVDPVRQQNIDSLRLFVSEDRGKTWRRQAECKPSEKEFTFVAPGDGLYWLAIQIVPKDGTTEPAKVSDLQPTQKVYVNTERRPIQRDKSYGELSEEVSQLKEAVKRLCSPPAEPDPGLVLASFDIPKHGDLLLVPVTIDQNTYKFGIDTGATKTMVDVSLRKHMGEARGKQKATNCHGKIIDIETFEPPPAKIGPLDFKLPHECQSSFQLFGFSLEKFSPGSVGLIDFAPVRKLTGHDIRGSIGMDFLRDHVFCIDFGRGKLWFLRSAADTTAPHVKINWGDNGCPTVAAQLAGQASTQFLVDTGHGGGATVGDVERDLFQRLLQAKAATDVEDGTASDFLGHEMKAQSALVKSIELGVFDHHELAFGAGHFSVLGLGYWSRYLVTFDFPNSVLYLTPAPGARSLIDRYCRIGVSLVSANERIVVESVKEGSAAARAGVKVGDIIMAIGNQSMKGVSVFDAYAALSSAGDRPSLTMRRGKESRQLTLLLAGQNSQTNSSGH
jgi:hypothetical protein